MGFSLFFSRRYKKMLSGFEVAKQVFLLAGKFGGDGD